MLSNNLRGYLSLLLVLAIAVSLVPVSAQASEEAVPAETAMEVIPETTVPTEAILQEEPSALPMLQQKMDDILMKYLGVTVLTEEEIIDIVNTMYWDDMEAALAECDALEPMISALSEDELTQIEATYEGTATIVCFYETMQLAMTPSFFAATGEYEPKTGIKVNVSGATDNSFSNGTLTVTAKGSAGILGFGASAKTATIKIKNSSTTDKATISFDWVASSVNQLKIDGTVYTGSTGSFSKLLEPETDFSITIQTAKNSTTNTLKLSGFNWFKAEDSYKVNFEYDSSLGSITVDGSNVSTETPKDIPLTGATLAASANSDAEFLGWIDTTDNNKILSNATSFTLEPAKAMTVKAIFVKKTSTEAWFRVGTNYLFSDLNAADTFAKSAASKLITLIRSGTLSSGKNYTISSGNSFLIPYSATDGGKFGAVPDTIETADPASGAYLTLTIPDNVELTVAGSMSVNAAQGTPGAGNTGQVTGKYGQVILNGSNSKITVTGSLTCYGYITGSGMVRASSGAEVYELFQLRDWRGGSATLKWYGLTGNTTTNSFVVNEFYIQNIEARYKVDSGALSYVSAAMSMAVVGVQQAQAVYIGSGGLFQLGTGSYVIREYKASEDRIYYELYGTVVTEGINLKVSTYELNSAKFILPIPHSMTITVKGTDSNGNILNSYATITKAFKLLPGAELIIEKYGTIEIKSDTSLYLYDLYDWVKDGTAAESYIYWGGNDSFTAVQTVRYSPSAKGTRKAQASGMLHIDGTLIGYSNIYTSANGSTQPDKVLTGTGEFVNNAVASGYKKIELDEIKNNDPGNVVTITTVPVVGLLAGISKDVADVNDSFGVGTYYGLGAEHSNYWYQTATATPATCTMQGYTTYNCDGGTGYVANYTDKLPHTPSSAATCTTAQTCTVCGVTLKEALGHTYVDHEAKIPTLKEAGHTAYQTCEHCDYTTYTALKAARVGETEYTILQDALTAADNGGTVTLLTNIGGNVIINQNLTIQTGGYAITVKAGENYYATPEQDNTIKVWKLIGFYGTNIAVQDSLDINFFLDGSLLKTDGNYIAKITRTKYTKDEKGAYTKPETTTLELSKDNWTARGQYFVFTYAEIAAKEMTDAVTVQIFEDGHPISIACQESVVSYAHRTLDKNPDNSELRTVLVDMLNYGTAAQMHFSYQTSVLANTDLTEAEQQEATQNVHYTDNHVIDENGLFAADTVTLESNLIYSFYFDFTEALTGDYALVSYQNAYGKNFTDIRIDNFRSNGIYSCVDVKELAIGDGYQIISCKVYDSNDTLIAECSSSIESYLAWNIDKNNSDPIYMSMMKFIQSAYNYFH